MGKVLVEGGRGGVVGVLWVGIDDSREGEVAAGGGDEDGFVAVEGGVGVTGAEILAGLLKGE